MQTRITKVPLCWMCDSSLRATLRLLSSERPRAFVNQTTKPTPPQAPFSHPGADAVVGHSMVHQCYVRAKRSGASFFYASTPFSDHAFSTTAPHYKSDDRGVYSSLKIITDAFGDFLVCPLEIQGLTYIYDTPVSTRAKRMTRDEKRAIINNCKQDSAEALFCIYATIVSLCRSNLFFNILYETRDADRLRQHLPLVLPAGRRCIHGVAPLSVVSVIDYARGPAADLLRLCAGSVRVESTAFVCKPPPPHGTKNRRLRATQIGESRKLTAASLARVGVVKTR